MKFSTYFENTIWENFLENYEKIILKMFKVILSKIQNSETIHRALGKS